MCHVMNSLSSHYSLSSVRVSNYLSNSIPNEQSLGMLYKGDERYRWVLELSGVTWYMEHTHPNLPPTWQKGLKDVIQLSLGL